MLRVSRGRSPAASAYGVLPSYAGELLFFLAYSQIYKLVLFFLDIRKLVPFTPVVLLGEATGKSLDSPW